MKTKFKHTLSILVLASIASSGITMNVQAAEFDYSYIDDTYENYNIVETDVIVAKLSGSYEIKLNINIIGEYTKGDIENSSSGSDFGFEKIAIGDECHYSITEKTDITNNIKQDTYTLDDYEVGDGVSHWLTDKVELDSNIDDSDDTTLEVEARYYLNEALSVGASYTTYGEDIDKISGNIRWNS